MIALRVIQGYFVGRGTVGPPAAIAASAAPRIQAKPAPGRPPLVHLAGAPVTQQRARTGNDAREIDPARIGLMRGGGKPLSGALLAKMEAAFGADFSAVRVHIGTQASRIGAIAFTTGNDLYFAPGHFQPDTARGQQLIGHELAHVIQQRQGRVRAPGSGVAIVRDHGLEAEADRLGMRAANHRPALQPKMAAAHRPATAWTSSHARLSRPGARHIQRSAEAVPVVADGKQPENDAAATFTKDAFIDPTQVPVYRGFQSKADSALRADKQRYPTGSAKAGTNTGMSVSASSAALVLLKKLPKRIKSLPPELTIQQTTANLSHGELITLKAMTIKEISDAFKAIKYWD